MTEIPEHLLKRSQERRAAIGGEAAPAAEPAPPGEAVEAAAEPAAAPAVPAPAAPPEVAPPPPAPVRPEVAAALQRNKIPFWALSVLVFLPLWAYVYQATLEPPPAGESDPIVLGEHVYGGCAACHGAGGGGGTGPELTGVLDTWPDFRDHLMWVRLGSTGWPADTYGANAKAKAGGMPGHAALSDAELAQVVLYERVTFGGLDPASEEYATLVEISEGHSTVADAGLGEQSQDAGVDEGSLAGG